MADPARRQQERLPCEIPVVLAAPTTGAKIAEARLVDLGLGGALLESPVPLQRGVPYEIRWTWQGRDLRLSARVAWEAKPGKTKLRRFGLAFTLTVAQEDLVRAQLDALRLGLWSTTRPKS
jgi:hypothetical protein